MKTTPISENSWQLTKYGLVNCYLVRENDGFTLVDTALKGCGDAILAAASTLGAPIKRILLTHAHVDHVGAVDELARALSPASPQQLAASARSIPLLRQPPDLATQPGEPTSKIKGGLPGIATQVTHELAEGELYGSLRVIETPGHIPGQLAFIDERDGTLFAGDTLVCVGNITISGYAPWYFPLPNFATWDRDTALASARKLLNFSFDKIAAGHGAIRFGGPAALRKAIAAL